MTLIAFLLMDLHSTPDRLGEGEECHFNNRQKAAETQGTWHGSHCDPNSVGSLAPPGAAEWVSG